MSAGELPTSTTDGPRAQGGVRKSGRRVWIILFLGLTLVGVALALRQSPWLREYQLKRASLTTLKSLAARSPTDALTQYHLGTRYYNDGVLPEALAAFRKAVERDPKMARAHLGVAVTYRKIGNLPEAYLAAEKSVALDPRSPEAQLVYALLVYTRSATQAIPEFAKLTRLAPTNAEGWYWLGVANSEIHQNGDAVAPLKRAAELAPNNAEYLRELGKVYMELSRYPEAKPYLEKAVSLSPEDVGAHYYLGKTILTSATDDAEIRRAGNLLDQSLELLLATQDPDPKRAAAIYVDRAEALKRLRRPKEALASLQEARRLDPARIQILFRMAELERKLGRGERARQLLTEYNAKNTLDTEIFQLSERIKQDQKNPGLRLRVARLFLRSGDLARAVNQYQMCLYLSPGQKDAARELAALQDRVSRAGGKPVGRQSAN